MSRIDEIEARMAEIAKELDNENADVDALEKEVRGLKDEKKAIAETAEKRQALRDEVAGGAGTVVRKFALDAAEDRSFNADSKEYRNAFLKDLLGLEMSKEERAAFVHTTANTTAVLPTTMLNQIWDLVSKQHAIMGDITIYRTGTILEVVKHTAITQGAAKTLSENTANDDEQNTFVKVTLSGKDFAKHVDISYAMERMSIDALEQYLVSEISASLGDAMAADVIAQIGTDTAAGNKVNSAAAGALTFTELAKLFGLLKRVGAVSVYATRSTIYNYLVGMVDSTGRPIFQPSAQAGQEGVVLGAAIKVEDAVADDVILIGDGSKVVYNMVQDIMIESDRDIRRHVTTYSGYARGQGALVDPNAFAQLTITAAGG
ncbi:phage major capsid protein [Gehongia tenuis]|uniref:Phage major capsid protein n=1 Tax=Gehongia tenuis TaxID=2763655 RepID=A0A926D4X9_9FIRM|nr:phage major capsid protein [Gehongia tenuis]MBC8531803.1 phage major capsid protein [Gehongia tenuis]